MIKKLLILAAVILFVKNISAQITITASDLQTIFPVGAQYLSHADTLTKSINIGGTGNFGTVNFSSVQSSTNYLTISENLSTSPFVADYPGAQYVFKNNQKYSGGDAESWMYTSFSDAYYVYGSATTTTIRGYNSIIKIKFNPAEQFYKFPVSYNSTFSQSASQSIETSFTDFPIPPTTTTNAWSMTQTVDGYGTMVTPDGKTLNCLRVKTETTINTPAGPSTNTSYNFITKTGESVNVSAVNGQPNNGTIQVVGISWSEGFGSSNSAVEKTNEIPKSFSLSQNFPNPFNPSTKISFSLPQRSTVSLKVYDVLGNEVSELANGDFESGVYNVEFNATNLSSGIYFYQLQSNGLIQTNKMILVK
jgi:hypothetical protein